MTPEQLEWRSEAVWPVQKWLNAERMLEIRRNPSGLNTLFHQLHMHFWFSIAIADELENGYISESKPEDIGAILIDMIISQSEKLELNQTVKV